MNMDDWNERERVERARTDRRERKVSPAGPEQIGARRAAELWTSAARKPVQLSHLDVPDQAPASGVPLALVVVALLLVLFAVLGRGA